MAMLVKNFVQLSAVTLSAGAPTAGAAVRSIARGILAPGSGLIIGEVDHDVSVS